jgi:hypothetical protein
MEEDVKMKYNIYDMMIIVAFVLFCFDSIPLGIAGAALITIGGWHIVRHENEYLDEYEDSDSDYPDKKTDGHAA